MSVCIAAIAEKNKIVMVSDSMVSLLDGTFSADGSMTKGGELVYHRWAAAFAGDDTTRVNPILTRVRKALSERKSFSVEEVTAVMLKEYQAERTAYATERYLSLYGMDMQQFLSNGSSVFGEQGFVVMRERIEQIDLGCVFLLHGFDDAGKPHIAVIDHPGVAQFINIGYWAIGSGAYMALSRLSLREQVDDLALARTVYNVLEGKSAAQRALGVGALTDLQIFESGRRALRIDPEVGRQVMSVCRGTLVSRVAPKCLRQIKGDLNRQDAKRRAAERESQRETKRSSSPTPQGSTRGR